MRPWLVVLGASLCWGGVCVMASVPTFPMWVVAIAHALALIVTLATWTVLVWR